MRFVTAHGLFPLRASSELTQILEALGVEGRALESLRLLALATFLDSIDESRASIRRAPGSFPLLESAISGAASFKGESASTPEDHPSGRSPYASPTAAITTRPQAEESRRGDVEVVVWRNREIPQDQVVSERNGRYVLS